MAGETPACFAMALPLNRWRRSAFVDPVEREGAAYGQFWERLGRGEYEAAQYRRLGKGGKEVWIQASYNPIFDSKGRPYKMVKFATDITASFRGKQLEAAVKETSEVIGRAKGKDLTGRISLEGKTGEVAQLCAGVNDLLRHAGRGRRLGARDRSRDRGRLRQDLCRQCPARRTH